MHELQTLSHSSIPANPSLFEFLKSETADLHLSIESVMPLLRADLTLAEYRSHLIKMLGFYTPLEARLSQYVQEFGDGLSIARRFKTQWIHADLIALGESTIDLAESSKNAGISKISSLPKCVGILYVIEGATLGAQVIRRSLLNNLNLDNTRMHFYNGYGSETLTMWQSLRSQAQNAVKDSEYSESGASARETFRLLLEWLRAS
jgi:heme oxygenase (biliverdin-IX-beta and delta-forming)